MPDADNIDRVMRDFVVQAIVAYYQGTDISSLISLDARRDVWKFRQTRSCVDQHAYDASAGARIDRP